MQDRVLGVIVVLIGLYSIWHGAGFSADKGIMASAGALPILNGVFLVVLGALLALTAGRKPEQFAGHWRRLACFGALTAAYILGLSHFGFKVSTPIYLFVLLLFTGDRPLKARVYAGVALAVMMTAGPYFLFDRMFRLLLP